MPLPMILLTAGAVILALMVLLWLVSLLLRNSSIVDIFWGAGFVLSAWLYFILTPDGFLQRKILIVTISTIWGLRLTLHVLLRNWKKGEDFRYQKWRKESGKIWWWKSLFQVFLLQGLLMWIISVPLLGAQFSDSPAGLTFLDFLGLSIWVIGFFFETVGDLQLKQFIKDPANKGRVLSSGVWHYTRHPNYFGDSAQWWAYYLIALAAGSWWCIISPILMTLFLIKVSGVALLERTMKESKPGYREYMESTSPFIPWFPKKNKPS
jgi:steroid 5-alpha reductase family enzyme